MPTLQRLACRIGKGKSMSEWMESISLLDLEDGSYFYMTGMDYRLPGPLGCDWILTAATGAIRLVGREMEKIGRGRHAADRS